MDLRRRLRDRRRRDQAGSCWLAVENGRVVCPRAGIVDVEACFTCPSFEGFSGGRVEQLVCTGLAPDESLMLRLVG